MATPTFPARRGERGAVYQRSQPDGSVITLRASRAGVVTIKSQAEADTAAAFHLPIVRTKPVTKTPAKPED